MVPYQGCNGYGQPLRKSSYDSMAFILDLTGCGYRTTQHIHHYTLLCSWFCQIFLTMFNHCHPGDAVLLLTGPCVPLWHLQGDLWPSGWVLWRARATGKRARGGGVIWTKIGISRGECLLALRAPVFRPLEQQRCQNVPVVVMFFWSV